VIRELDVGPQHRPKIIEGTTLELRTVVGIFRHGDRTPKQKLKFVTSEPLLLQFITNPNKEIKIKRVDMMH
jgi:hypothetical protein